MNTHTPGFLLGMAGVVLTTGLAQETKSPKQVATNEVPFVLPHNVSVERDIVYAKYGTRELKLDLFRPKDRSAAPLPCIIVVPGGGWRNDFQQRFARHASYLAGKGFVTVCIGYRLMPEVGVPECVQDTKAAVRWVRANAARHGIDPDRIGALGSSAGGHLVAMLGTSHKAQKLEGTGGNSGMSSRVHAVVAMAPPVDLIGWRERTGLDEATTAAMSPVTYVDRDSAPLLLQHGEADTSVPLRESELILAKYQAAGASAGLVKYPDGHSFWHHDRFAESMDRSAAFFREKLTVK